ncbi:hypothetical protein BZA70DRAFT_271892 [Myxozyma melibiosi]|uniref:SnoaL-like domain-containing protein n=1 Tax=Myxozyma melibiosi TaxID=54550 RepID=A0ABR1FCU5_9ASCO
MPSPASYVPHPHLTFSASPDQRMEAKIQELLDIQEIRDISIRYNRYADAADGDSFASLWLDDGEFDIHGDKVYKGHEEIAFACRAATEVLHFVVDSQVTVEGETARQTSKLLLFHRDQPERKDIEFACTTTLSDVFVKRDGKWYIKYRQSKIDMDKDSAFRKMKLVR